MLKLTAALASAALLTGINQVHAQNLNGSRAAMQQQHEHAVSHGFGFAETSTQVRQFANAGQLVRVQSNRDIRLHNISYPYLLPQVRTLVERLGAQYHNACGERLVVTSMTRPIARQPINAHNLSVHPAGMAFDLRVPSNRNCRSWLENTLISLESSGVLHAIRERRPPHYHVAVFPGPYERYLATITGRTHEYVVRRGDTLSGIAARHNTSVARLRSVNALSSDVIRVGQELQVPGTQPRVVEHEVQPGETLWRLARRYNTSVDTLKNVNDLANDRLIVGQLLRVSVGES